MTIFSIHVVLTLPLKGKRKGTLKTVHQLHIRILSFREFVSVMPVVVRPACIRPR